MSQWPLVVNRLVTLLPTLSGWSGVQVFDGRPVVVENVDYCLVGYANEDADGNFTSGSFGAALSPVGNFFEEESGQVECQVSCNSGDDDLASVRARLIVLYEALNSALKANRTLGVLPPGSVATLRADVLGTKNQQGTGITAIFTVSYVTQAF